MHKKEHEDEAIEEAIKKDLRSGNSKSIRKYASDGDAWTRKNTAIIMGMIYRDYPDFRERITIVLEELFKYKNIKLKQSIIYSLGEIGKNTSIDEGKILGMLEVSLKDKRRSVRKAVIDALKQLGAKNPEHALKFARKFLHNPDPEIRRGIVQIIETTGETTLEDTLLLLAELQNDPDIKVRKTIIRALGQISYKKGCLEKVISALKKWENKKLVKKSLKEILKVNKRNGKISTKLYEEVKEQLGK